MFFSVVETEAAAGRVQGRNHFTICSVRISFSMHLMFCWISFVPKFCRLLEAVFKARAEQHEKNQLDHSILEPFWGLGTSCRPLGAVLEKSIEKHENPQSDQSIFEAFLSQKNEVISSLNSTCCCLYFYFSRMLPRTHLDAFGCPKVATRTPKGTLRWLLGIKSGPKVGPKWSLSEMTRTYFW